MVTTPFATVAVAEKPGAKLPMTVIRKLRLADKRGDPLSVTLTSIV
jgi:hypothetical protein